MGQKGKPKQPRAPHLKVEQVGEIIRLTWDEPLKEPKEDEVDATEEKHDEPS